MNYEYWGVRGMHEELRIFGLGSQAPAFVFC
jgi:hypothetical protein